MATGVRLPVRADGNGRTQLVEGAEYTHQRVMLALSNLASDNPFGSPGSFDDSIFADDTSGQRAAISRRLRRVFATLEASRTARLISAQFLDEGREEGELSLVVVYLDMETNEQRDVRRTIAITRTR